MAAIQPPISAPPHFIPRFSNTTSTKPTHIMAPLTKPTTKNPTFCWNPTWFNKPIYPVRVADQSSNLVGDEQSEELLKNVDQIKQEIYHILKDVNRGIFGVPSEKKTYIESLVKLLESQNPTPHPTSNLDKTIDIVKGKAVNMIEFDVKGLNLLNGKLSIEASYKISSKSRVDISYENSSIVPDQLMNVFRKNYDLLLGIFNPEGWLEITYVDDTTRIGRDDKGNLFILEKSEAKS